MLYDEEAVRANIRNRDGKRVYYLGKGDQLTSAARDYLSRERIEILPASQGRPQRYRLEGGGYLEEKPEHMTHLHSDLLVPKDHPRIVFRGKLDTLEAELILAQLDAPQVQEQLEEVLTLTRKLVACEVLGEPVALGTLCGMTEAEVRKRSHFPADYYGQPHFMPSSRDGRAIARLNRARTAAREAELAACAAFRDREAGCSRRDILQALNRISSVLYLLMVQEKGRNL